MRCYIFDLDGTLCDIRHRLHYIDEAAYNEKFLEEVTACAGSPTLFKKDWDGFNAACVGDAPIKPMCELAWHLAQMVPVLFVSGRSEVVRKQTLHWLAYHVDSAIGVRGAHLWMRPDGDHRPDHELKGLILDEILAAGWEPIMCFDDRSSVVKMWRERGMVCAQVAEGEF